jgi:predicted DNA-binding protein (UPF0251 family)
MTNDQSGYISHFNRVTPLLEELRRRISSRAWRIVRLRAFAYLTQKEIARRERISQAAVCKALTVARRVAMAIALVMRVPVPQW